MAEPGIEEKMKFIDKKKKKIRFHIELPFREFL